MKLRANGIDIHYRISVTNPTHPWLTLLHSLSTDLSLWDELSAELATKFNVLRFDARGHGATAIPAAPYHFDELLKDLVGVLDALSIQRTHLVGLSMGGMLAQHAALAIPERIDRLVIVSSTSNTPPQAATLWDERIALARAKGMQAHVESTLARWFTETYRLQHPAVMARIAALISTTPVEGYAGWGAAIQSLNLTHALAGIKAPTLVVVGADDPGTPVSASEVIAKAIPGARLEIIPSASHQLVIEQADTFSRCLQDFLRA